MPPAAWQGPDIKNPKPETVRLISFTARGNYRTDVALAIGSSVSPNKFDKSVKDADDPPYPAEAFYDVELWHFCRKQGAKGALIWNVAG